MGHVKHDTEQQVQRPRRVAGELKTAKGSRPEEILDRVEQLVAGRQYDKAVDLLKSAGGDVRLVNARGVCLLRLGRFNEAVRLFRDLVLSPGCVWLRPDVPPQYVTNYATALLLGGHPAGCVEILAMMNDQQNSTVARLRDAVKQWERQLTLWQRLNWRFGHIEPENRPVAIDFEAGEFERWLADKNVTHPAGPGSPRRAA